MWSKMLTFSNLSMILFHSVSSTFIWISLQLVSHIHLQLRLRECCSTSLPSTYLVACTGTILPLYLWASISLICSYCDNEKLCLYLPASSDSNCINTEKEKNIFSETLYVRHWTLDTYVTPSSSFCFISQKCSSVKRVLWPTEQCWQLRTRRSRNYIPVTGYWLTGILANYF